MVTKEAVTNRRARARARAKRSKIIRAGPTIVEVASLVLQKVMLGMVVAMAMARLRAHGCSVQVVAIARVTG